MSSLPKTVTSKIFRTPTRTEKTYFWGTPFIGVLTWVGEVYLAMPAPVAASFAAGVVAFAAFLTDELT